MTPASARETATGEWVALADERIIATLVGTMASAEYHGISWGGWCTTWPA